MIGEIVVEKPAPASTPACASCPSCTRPLNVSLDLEAGDLAAPAPGVLTVCVFCGAVLEFGPELELVRVNVAALPEPARVRLAKAVEDLIAALKNANADGEP